MALTLDPSKRNDIIIRQGQSLNFSFLLTNESDGEDFPVAGYTFNLKIYDRRRTLLFDLTDGDGLTVQDGSVAVSISDNDLDIPDGDYKYFLWVTNPSNQMTTWINGYAKVKDSLSVGSQDDVSVTVSDADNNVNITISISGSTLSAGDQTKIDNLPENTTQELAAKADKAVSLGAFNPVGVTLNSSGDYDDLIVSSNLAPTFFGTHVNRSKRRVKLTFDGSNTLTFQSGINIVGNSIANGQAPFSGVYMLEMEYYNNSIQVELISLEEVGAEVPISAPTNFTAIAGDEQVSLSWSHDIADTTFEIERDTDINFSSPTPVEEYADDTAKSVVDGSLTNDQQYFWRVRALKDGYLPSDWVTVSATPEVTFVNTHSLVIDAQNEAVSLIDNSIYPSEGSGVDTAISIELWFKTPSSLDTTRFMLRAFAGASQAIRMYYAATKPRFAFDSSAGNAMIAEFDETLQADTWYQMIATYSGNKQITGVEGYINGVQKTKSDESVGSYVGLPDLDSDDFDIRIPRYSDANFGKGKYNFIRVFNRVLTPTECTDLAGSAPKSLTQAGINPADCVWEYPFNNNLIATIGTNPTQVGTPTFDTDIPS